MASNKMKKKSFKGNNDFNVKEGGPFDMAFANKALSY